MPVSVAGSTMGAGGRGRLRGGTLGAGLMACARGGSWSSHATSAGAHADKIITLDRRLNMATPFTHCHRTRSGEAIPRLQDIAEQKTRKSALSPLGINIYCYLLYSKLRRRHLSRRVIGIHHTQRPGHQFGGIGAQDLLLDSQNLCGMH